MVKGVLGGARNEGPTFESATNVTPWIFIVASSSIDIRTAKLYKYLRTPVMIVKERGEREVGI